MDSPPRTDDGTIVRVERATRALRMRKEGHTFREIAEDLGVSVGTVRNDVVESLRELEWERNEEAMEIRAMVMDRNQEAVRAIYERVLGGDLNALDRMIRLNEQLLDMVGARSVDLTSGGRPLEGGVRIIEVIVPGEPPMSSPDPSPTVVVTPEDLDGRQPL